MELRIAKRENDPYFYWRIKWKEIENALSKLKDDETIILDLSKDQDVADFTTILKNQTKIHKDMKVSFRGNIVRIWKEAVRESIGSIENKNGNYSKGKEYKCLRCGESWISRKHERPRHCAKCKSSYWDKEKV